MKKALLLAAVAMLLPMASHAQESAGLTEFPDTHSWYQLKNNQGSGIREDSYLGYYPETPWIIIPAGTANGASAKTEGTNQYICPAAPFEATSSQAVKDGQLWRWEPNADGTAYALICKAFPDGAVSNEILNNANGQNASRWGYVADRTAEPDKVCWFTLSNMTSADATPVSRIVFNNPVAPSYKYMAIAGGPQSYQIMRYNTTEASTEWKFIYNSDYIGEDLESAARALWARKMANNGYYTWAKAIHPVCARAVLDTYPESLTASLTAENIESTINSYDVTQQITAINAAIVNAINEADLCVRIFNFYRYNLNNDHIYLTVTGSDNDQLKGIFNATRKTKWELELDDNGAVLFKNAATGKYIPAIPANGANYSTLVDKASAGPHEIRMTSNASAWIVGLNTSNRLYMHCNVGQTGTEANVVSAEGDWHHSQWMLEACDKRSDEEIAFDEIKAELLSDLSAYDGGLNGFWSADEIATAKAAVEAVTFEREANDLTDEYTTKSNELDAIAAGLWANYDHKQVLIKYDRRSAYLAATGDNLATTTTLGAANVWQLNRVAGGMRFNLFNPSTGKYASALTMAATAEANTAIYRLDKCVKTNFTDYLVITCINQSGNNKVVHKNNNNDTGLIWFHSDDAGSALNVLKTDEELGAIRSTLISPAIGEELRSPTYQLGKYNTAVINEVEQGNISSATLLADLNNLLTLASTVHTRALYMPVNGTYMRLRASAGNPARTDEVVPILKWYETTGNGYTTLANEAADGFEDKGTIFVYYGEKLLCADNHLYVTNAATASNGNNTNSDHLDFATTAAQNDNASRVRFVPGYDELGTYQMVLGEKYNIHIYPTDNANSLGLDRCSTEYPGQKTDSQHNWTLEQVETATVTVAIHADGFGSLVSPNHVVVPGYSTGISLYVAYMDKEVLKLAPVEDEGMLIDPESHILVKAEPNSTVTLNVVHIPADDDVIHNHTAHDKLVGSFAAKAVAPIANHNVYVKMENPANAGAPVMLTDGEEGGEVENESTFTLVKLTPENGKVTIPAGAMAVNVGNATANTVAVSLTNGLDTSTAINEITFDGHNGADVIYDLQGRRLTAPAKGINIINGKKVMIK